MSNYNSKEYIAAYAPHTNTWGATEGTCGAGMGILLTSDGRSFSQEEEPVEETDTSFAGQGDQTAIVADYSLKGWLRFDSGGLYTAMAHVLGTVATSTVTDGGATVFGYGKRMTPAVDTEGLYGTYAIHKTTEVYSVPSLKPFGFTISGEGGGKKLIQTISCMGDREVEDSAINTPTIMATVTYDDRQNRVLYDQMTHWMNGATAATLSSTDAIKPISFDIEFTRNYDPFYTTEKYREQPVDDGHPTITLKQTFPRIGAIERAIYTDWRAGTHKKLQMLATGAIFTGATTKYRLFRVKYPRLKITDVDHGFDGQGRKSITVTYNAYDATDFGGAPSGFDSALPIEVYFLHTRTTQF